MVYYKNGEPCHAGAIEVDGSIYYIGSGGRAVKGRHTVHSGMTNGLLQRGTYEFGEDYKLVKKVRGVSKKKKKKHRTADAGLVRLGIGLAALAVLLLAVVGIDHLITINHPTLTQQPTQETTAPEEVVILPDFKEEVWLCSEAARQLDEGKISLREAAYSGNPYRGLVFSYTLENTTGTLVLSEDPELTNAREFVLDPAGNSLVIDNLKTGTEYYFKVITGEREYPGSFRTAKSPRFVHIPGVENTRDIGGYVTQDGKKVKQGLLIRGVELDGLVESRYLLPKDSVQWVKETLGIVYDFDLRHPEIYAGEFKTRLGEDVGHYFYDSPMYGNIFNDISYPNLRRIFQDLASPDHYPMYMHCTWGMERTGTIVFLLQGVLNVSTEDMMKEYRLTAFANKTVVSNDTMDIVIDGMTGFEGDTLQEQIVTFLTQEIGVTEKEIESIRAIFLED